MRIGIVGTGTIATAVVRGIADHGHTITVSERSASNANKLASDYACVSIATNQGVLDQSDVVIVGLMPEVAPDILRGLTFRPDHKVLSLIAAIPLDDIGTLVSPAQASATVLPYPAVAQGGSPVLAMGEMDLVNRIFGQRNPIYRIETAAELDAYLCAQAMLSVVARMTGDTARWLGSRIEHPEKGERFLRDLVSSSLLMSPADALLDALNTEGGYNQRLRQHMDAHGLREALSAGLDALES